MRLFVHVCVSMRKTLTVLVILCLPYSSNSQPELSFSLKAGPNAAAAGREQNALKYGLSAGVAGDLRWSSAARFSLGAQLALLYVPRGVKVISPSTGEFIGAFRRHYIDTTAALRPAARIGPANLYLLLGGGWAFLLRAIRESVNTPGQKDDVTNGFGRHDLTLLVGAGVWASLPSKRLGPFRLGTVFVETRYDRGLLDHVRAEDSSAKNRTTSLMFGMSFTLGFNATVSPVPPTSAPVTSATHICSRSLREQ
jgi:hypothetical protein